MNYVVEREKRKEKLQRRHMRAFVGELLSTDDTRERPSFDVVGTREGVAAVSLDCVEPRAALSSPGSFDHFRRLVHTLKHLPVFSTVVTRCQVAAVLSRPPDRTLLPCWDHHLHVTFCHVTHRTRHVVIEQVPSVVSL